MTSTGRAAGALIGFAALAAAITGGILVVGSDEPAGAAELEQFASCTELESWVASTEATGGADDAGIGLERQVLEESGGDATAGAPAAADAGTGGTNTVVAGVDEIDVIDRVGDDRVLVSRNGALSLVDLDDRAVVDHLEGLPWDARVSVADGLAWIAGSTSDGTTGDGSGVRVVRARVDGDSLTVEGEWSTPGWLLDARRSGGRLHVVAVDQPGTGVVPFDGGPVPCDQVWRPVDPATTPAATLVASLPDTGDVAPVAAAEVVGGAGNLLVTATSAYVATETFADDGGVATGVHRFELAGLTPTGSGSVPGSVAGPFALDESDGRLRVATSLPSFTVLPIEGDAVVGAPEPASEPVPAPGPTDEPLAEVFVLDTEGDLDVLGRTGRFGHAGEAIQGVRFLGDLAYVVTFLQTDPFWVVDLADPAAPRVVGELEIPGFSAYLHPAGEGRVIGFGPDAQGAVAARLFDVDDPAAPSLLDELRLGDDSPVAWDHHAFVGLDGGRFAVPVNEWPDVVSERCVEPVPVAGDEAIAPCEVVTSGGETGMAVLAVEGGRLVLAERAAVETDGSYAAERGVLAPDGVWLLLSWDRMVPTDGGDPIVLPADPSTGTAVAEG